MGTPRDNNQAQLYNGIDSHNDYSIYPGVCVLPLAETPPTNPNELTNYSPVVVLRLHAPYRIRGYTYLADKKNNPPVLPQPIDCGAFIFLGGDLSFSNYLNTTYSNFDWKVSANYMFVENAAYQITDGFVLGVPGFSWASSTINAQQGYTLPPTGAAAQAGLDVAVGYYQGQQILGDPQTGSLKMIWGYNTPSYYPGTLLNSAMANGG